MSCKRIDIRRNNVTEIQLKWQHSTKLHLALTQQRRTWLAVEPPAFSHLERLAGGWKAKDSNCTSACHWQWLCKFEFGVYKWPPAVFQVALVHAALQMLSNPFHHLLLPRIFYAQNGPQKNRPCYFGVLPWHQSHLPQRIHWCDITPEASNPSPPCLRFPINSSLFRNSSLQKAFTDLTNKTKHHNFEKEKPHCEHCDWFKWSFWFIALRKPCSKHHLSPLADSFEVAVAVGFQHLPPTLWVHPEQSGFTIAGVFSNCWIQSNANQQCQSSTMPVSNNTIK